MEQASRGQSKGAAHFKVRHRKKVTRTDFPNWFHDLIFITGKWATPIKGEERHSRNYHKIMRYNGTRRQFAHFFGLKIWLSVSFCTFFSVEITTSLVSLKSDRCLKRTGKMSHNEKWDENWKRFFCTRKWTECNKYANAKSHLTAMTSREIKSE